MTIRTLFGKTGLVLLLALPCLVHAQPFAEVDQALVDYARADLAPSEVCEAVGDFESDEIVRISATPAKRSTTREESPNATRPSNSVLPSPRPIPDTIRPPNRARASF